ncbi:PIN domain-containing protein [Pantanalinema rosaneae CENA516]|uniref:PIN domain-containing protein n=1 Tax=Pantanalinema rosaneae TaxID=1620701 RepID=UPI003D6FB5F2
MSLLPPLLIVLDISALLAGRTRDWQEFSRTGECYVPRAVLDEMAVLKDHAPEPEIESIAREFDRFYPQSGWKEATAIADHESLKPAAGHTLSKKARLSTTVLQHVYGLAERRSDALVVLVANDQPLLKRLPALDMPNLCGLPLPALINWSRTQRRPPVVTHHMQDMKKSPAQVASNVAARPTSTSGPKAIAKPSAGVQPLPNRPTSVTPEQWDARRPKRQFPIKPLVSNLVSLLVLAFIAGGIWRFAHPSSFAQVWNQLPFVEQPTKKAK